MTPTPALDASQAWLATHSAAYAGQWVAVEDGVLLATAASFFGLQRALLTQGHAMNPDMLVVKVLPRAAEAPSPECLPLQEDPPRPCSACAHGLHWIHRCDAHCPLCACLEYRDAPHDTALALALLWANAGPGPLEVQCWRDRLTACHIPADVPAVRWRSDIRRALIAYGVETTEEPPHDP